MNIQTLCDKIELQPYIKERVLAFAQTADFAKIDELQKGYYTFETMYETLLNVQEWLGEDKDGTKILTCLLRAACNTHAIYQEKGISDDIYFETMKCFPRYISETYVSTGKWAFDRHIWTTRQSGGHLFRLGQLEYEIKRGEGSVVIGVHIPSNAKFSPDLVDESLEKAHAFFETYYPELKDAEYHCHSWLMDRQLGQMLGEDANITRFQNRFEIFDEGAESWDFLEWLFRTKSTDYTTLSEETSLQRKVKKHVLAGGKMWTAYGRLK